VTDRRTDRWTDGQNYDSQDRASIARAVKTVRLIISDRCLFVCLSCLSVTLVYCRQTVGWIRVPLDMEVGLGQGHIVLDRDPALHPKRGTTPYFGPYLLGSNGWMDHDATWYGGRPRARRHCVRCATQLPPPKKKGEGHSSPNFSAHMLWPNGWMDQDASLYGGRPRPRSHCVDGDPPSPLKSAGPSSRHGNGHSSTPLFGSLCSGTIAHLSNC